MRWQWFREWCSFFESWLGASRRGSPKLHGQLVMQASNPNDSWYETIEGEEIEQGDLLVGFEVFVPSQISTPDSTEISGELQTFDFVLMTQTCDIQHGKVRSLLLCPFWDLWKFIERAKAQGENWGRNQREALRRGNLPGYHLLNENVQDGITIGLIVVDFHEVHTAPTDRVREFARHFGKRLRLRSPYKEHLAQAFARFFMRVGLPVDIPADRLRTRPQG